MPQLNVHVPASSTLLARVDDAARQLGTTPSALARIVLDVALEPYLQAQLALREREQAYASRVVASLRNRFSGALPARPFVAAGEPEETARAEEAKAAADQELDVDSATSATSAARREPADGAALQVRPARRTDHAVRRGAATRPTRRASNGVGRPLRPAAAARSTAATR